MEPLHIKATDLTPLIIFYPENHELKIEGKMIPEDVENAFVPVFKWIDDYLSKNEPLHFLFRLYYYNTSASRQFYHLFKKMDAYYAGGKKISARWEYEEGDEESKADAEEFLNGVTFPYEIVDVSG